MVKLKMNMRNLDIVKHNLDNGYGRIWRYVFSTGRSPSLLISCKWKSFCGGARDQDCILAYTVGTYLIPVSLALRKGVSSFNSV
jgi:hypothetical protein